MDGINITCYKFDDKTSSVLKGVEHGSNWPVVYIINNKNEAYIGETTNASIRSNQHYANEERRKLKKITIIDDKKANKSSILDLESFLIKHMSADKTFMLQNGNNGLQNHNYYNKDKYESNFEGIWEELKKAKLVCKDLKDIRNSDLFKYSPYKSLTDEQYAIINDIIGVLADDVKRNKNSMFFIHGGAGTGKTILGVYLIKLLTLAKNGENLEIDTEQAEQNLTDILNINEAIESLKIALVIPMDNLRATLKKVFKNIKGLNPKMVLSPNDVVKSNEYYDLLIVDEAHRLKQRKAITQYGTFDQNNRKLNLDKDGTQLDWILLRSKYQIFFYDEKQTVKPADVPKEKFKLLFEKDNCHQYRLKTQLRCLAGGDEYIEFVNRLFSDNPPDKKYVSENYDVKLFSDVNDMVEAIKAKDEEYGLCRTVAGYAWKWRTKGKNLPLHVKQKDLAEMVAKGVYDIEINGYKYIWNSKPTDWINSPNSANEIGSIHTVQGFDLNYVGIIIGNELKYDQTNKRFVVDRNNYYDRNGKNSTTDDELLSFLLNIYGVMFTRGIKGIYVYACDNGLREYLKEYIEKND